VLPAALSLLLDRVAAWGAISRRGTTASHILSVYPVRTLCNGVSVSPGCRPNRGASVDHVDEAEKTSCKRCRRRLKVAAAGLCTACAAIVATPAVSMAATLPVSPTFQFVYVPGLRAIPSRSTRPSRTRLWTGRSSR